MYKCKNAIMAKTDYEIPKGKEARGIGCQRGWDQQQGISKSVSEYVSNTCILLHGEVMKVESK